MSPCAKVTVLAVASASRSESPVAGAHRLIACEFTSGQGRSNSEMKASGATCSHYTCLVRYCIWRSKFSDWAPLLHHWFDQCVSVQTWRGFWQNRLHPQFLLKETLVLTYYSSKGPRRVFLEYKHVYFLKFHEKPIHKERN